MAFSNLFLSKNKVFYINTFIGCFVVMWALSIWYEGCKKQRLKEKGAKIKIIETIPDDALKLPKDSIKQRFPIKNN